MLSVGECIRELALDRASLGNALGVARTRHGCMSTAGDISREASLRPGSDRSYPALKQVTGEAFQVRAPPGFGKRNGGAEIDMCKRRPGSANPVRCVVR